MSIGQAIAVGLPDAGPDVDIQAAPASDAPLWLANAAALILADISQRGRGSGVIAAYFAVTATIAAPCDAEANLGGLDIPVICASVQIRRASWTPTPLKSAARSGEISPQ